MKKKELKETKPALKSTGKVKEPPAPKPDGRKSNGGARPGSGRPKKPFETKQIHIDAPTELLDGMERVGVENKTAYITSLIAVDLGKRNFPAAKKKTFKTIALSPGGVNDLKG